MAKTLRDQAVCGTFHTMYATGAGPMRGSALLDWGTQVTPTEMVIEINRRISRGEIVDIEDWMLVHDGNPCSWCGDNYYDFLEEVMGAGA